MVASTRRTARANGEEPSEGPQAVTSSVQANSTANATSTPPPLRLDPQNRRQGSDSPVNSEEWPHSESDSRADSPDGNGEENGPTQNSCNAANGCWLAWHDRVLAKVVFDKRPFDAARGSTSREWKEVAVACKDASKGEINRSGDACKNRMKRLVEIHKVSTLILLRGGRRS